MTAPDALAVAVLLGLVAYRVWRLAALDTILDRPRAWLYGRADPSGGWAWWAAELLGCPWCLGFWVSGGLTVAVAAGLGWSWWLLAVWWASSAVAGLAATLAGDAGNDA